MTGPRFATVAAHFAREAGYWNSAYQAADVASTIYQERLARALIWVDRLALAGGARALDVGAGAGQAAIALAARGLQVDAVDAAPAMAELVQHNAERAGVSQRVNAAPGDAQALSFPPATFDLVLGLGMLPWVPAPPLALGEIVRVLRPGGYAIVSFANRDRLTFRLDPLHNQDVQLVKRPIRAWLERRGRWPAHGPEPDLLSIDASNRLLTAAGLELLTGVSFGFGPFTLLGRHLFSDAVDVALDGRLRRVKALRQAGTEYLVLARHR